MKKVNGKVFENTDSMVMFILNNLIEYMEEEGINQATVAERSGLNISTVWRTMQLEYSPKFETLAQIYYGLNLSLGNVIVEFEKSVKNKK